MSVDTESILHRALAARLKGDLPDEFAQDIADLVTELRSLRETASAGQPEIHGVTGTHHQAGAVRPSGIGRKQRVGFQHGAAS